MRAKSSVEKIFITGLLASAIGLTTMGGASAQTAASSGCGLPGVVKVAVTAEVADTFVIPFAANSSELTPVAERVLDAAAAAYPQQQALYLRIQGGEPRSETETLVSIDRLTWVTAYLTARDVPLQAMVFESPAVAQMGCASIGTSL